MVRKRMMYLFGTLLAPLMAIVGTGLLMVGALDRRDGFVIAGAILLGSVLIAERQRGKSTAGDRTL
jgi:hypothetical protein